MIFSDLFEETFLALESNKARSLLTILGIVIGISSVIVMVSIGQGAQSSISSSIESIGSNLITVSPGAQRSRGSGVSSGAGSAKTLTQEDAEAVAKIPLVQAVAPENSGRYQVTAKGANTNTSIDGVTPAYTEVKNVTLAEGNFISEQNLSNYGKVAVLGSTVRDDLFGEAAGDVVGQIVRIKNLEFKIIGITEAKGGSGFGSQDDMIFIPLTTAQRYLSGSETITTLNIQVVDSDSMAAVEEETTSLLLDRHGISDPESADFSIMNQADLISTASSVTETFTLLLAAIAGISLVVGGIGIMNMMLTNVTERTREIGLRKAIGAKRHEISQQFLAEAIMLTSVGGIIGILLGWGLAFVITLTGITQTKISLTSVLLAFGVSTLIGIVFGYYPAKRAANMNPIEALRYE
ncbi:MAG: ABC transporter, permease protein [Candidatus Uhrbacteria bacterium GW2011_GWE2_45_35]|uniref:ABC transporter, permease protein n=2 Tax=Candidatus Uhriibacteriota TaxID=1752732 RepID=A0A0G1JAN7_9BACT|nr:MAG: ABC transporter, permease protein [Candidatus Uhrbacteria bacterium GW2011_GWF2_44_350]KKU05972.1 MAG: ABC transporter, permease protein [Candidatus Uhrbacteria bacterium GW2011_GWE2_45_35]HBR81161.1 multidrug ABC transporter substrate-binding protein [Candidatus Uhrbacteria bacterium]HCU31996.1 multidrug ABC transporter substrate-binding protein [Candidatus Uhrbacteria bacterium]